MAVNMGSAIAYLELDTSKFKQGFKSALDDLRVFKSKTATIEQKLGGLQSSLKKTGGMLSRTVTLPLVGVGALATKTAIKFEDGMAQVQAISGATADEFVRLENKAIEMGAKTKFSASESADAFRYMAQAGWKTEDMLDGIEGIMNLAAASGEDLALTSDIVTDALTAFGLQAKDSAYFSDVLAKASSSTNTNVALMGETFKYVAPVAGALGYSIEDTAIAIGLMANQGIKGSQAGTALRAIMTRLVKPTKQSAEAMGDLGIEVANADGSMKPWMQTMTELREKFSGLTQEQKAQYAALLAGQEGMSGFLAIINSSDEDFAKLTEEINNATGASQEMADIMMDTTGGAVEQLKGALESAGIIIGKKLTPYIRKLAEWVTTLVEKFNSLSDEEQDQIVKYGLIAAAVGPVLLIMSKLVGVVASVVNVFKLFSKVPTMLSGMALPLVSIVAIIGTLIGAFATLWKTSESFRNNITATFERIRDLFSGFADGVVERINSFGFEFENITQVLGAVWTAFCDILKPLFEGSFEGVADVVETVLNAILNIFDFWKAVFEGDWEQVGESFSQFWTDLFDNVTEFFSGFFETIGEFGSTILEKLGLEEASTKFSEFFEGLSKWFSELPETISGFVEKVKEFFTVTIPEAISNFVNVTLPEKIEAIKQWFAELPHALGVKVGEMIGHVFNFGVRFGEWIQNDLPKHIDNIVEWFKKLPHRIWEWLKNTLNKVYEWGKDMGRKAKEVGKEFVDKLIKFFKELPGKVKEEIKKIPDKIKEIGKDMKQAGKDILNKLWDGVKSVGKDIEEWFSGFADKIGGFVRGIVDGFKSVVSGANDAKSAASSVDGSHANGLSYVPKNGYIAELHKGERVLTKQENEEYNDKETRNGDTYNFYNTRPDPYEYSRQMKKAKRDLLYGF